jgi:hypothetical protein
VRPAGGRPSGGDRFRWSPVLRYVAAWVLAGTAIVAAIVVITGGGEDDSVSLPPVRQPDLTDGVRSGGCELRLARRDEQLNPPVVGSLSVPPAAPGIYDRSPDVESLVAALRQGLVVVQYRPGLDRERVDELRTLQRAVPTGTIVTPNATGMPFELAVTAWRRLLGCPRFSEETIDAIRLFRGRYLGRGANG